MKMHILNLGRLLVVLLLCGGVKKGNNKNEKFLVKLLNY